LMLQQMAVEREGGRPSRRQARIHLRKLS
jgi:hypothetical protein